MSTELLFRRDLDAAAAAGDRNHWLYVRNCYADWLMENGRESEGEKVFLGMQFPLEPSSDWPATGEDVESFAHLSVHQRQQLQRALTRPLGVLTGSPGTGKTTTASALVLHLCREFGTRHIAVCAPTGKAAVRCREALEKERDRQRCDIELPVPKTIHSLLRISRAGYDGGGWEFEFHSGWPLPSKFVVVDEASMLGTDLASSLLSACADTSHVLLVGDVGQLPPVGHGSPLRDMIHAGVPCGELTEIHRNAGAIVKACAKIRDESEFDVCERYDRETGANLLHVEERYTPKIIEAVVGIIKSMQRPDSRFNPAVDVQVLCAVNEKGDLARTKLNLILQNVMNGKVVAERGAPFRNGDKIICLQNGLYPLAGSLQDTEYVANGEIGHVTSSTSRITTAQFGRTLIDIRRHELEHFDLAYAVTVHKCQGSQYPVIIIPIDQSPAGNMTTGREWWYTGISRASELCITVGRREVMGLQARRPRLSRRKTFLTELIEEGMKDVL